MEENEFALTINEQIPFLNRRALSLTKDLEDANDLVQDTLIKAVRYYDTYEKGSNLQGWLFVIMKNTFINNKIRDTRRRGIVTQDDEISSANLLYSANRNQATESFVMQDINKVLAIVPNVYRVPFVLYVEGYRYHEIAERFNLPLGTVKNRIFYARALLKKHLKVYKNQ